VVERQGEDLPAVAGTPVASVLRDGVGRELPLVPRELAGGLEVHEEERPGEVRAAREVGSPGRRGGYAPAAEEQDAREQEREQDSAHLVKSIAERSPEKAASSERLKVACRRRRADPIKTSASCRMIQETFR
jgi:hypothetical protein